MKELQINLSLADCFTLHTAAMNLGIRLDLQYDSTGATALRLSDEDVVRWCQEVEELRYELTSLGMPSRRRSELMFKLRAQLAKAKKEIQSPRKLYLGGK